MWFRKFANLKACKTTAKHMFINTNDFKLVLYSSVVYVYEFVHSMEQRLGSNWYGSSVMHMEATMSRSCRCCLMSLLISIRHEWVYQDCSFPVCCEMVVLVYGNFTLTKSWLCWCIPSVGSVCSTLHFTCRIDSNNYGFTFQASFFQ